MADSNIPLKSFENNKRIIAINTKNCLEKKYFTIAHEIAHFVLHCNNKQNFFEKYIFRLNQYETVETDADIFAMELLMPEHIFKEFIQKNNCISKNKLIEKVCHKFIVLPIHAEKRFHELNIDENKYYS